MNKFRVRLSWMMIALIGLSVTASGIFAATMWKTTQLNTMKETLVREIRIIQTTVEWTSGGQQPDRLRYYENLAKQLKQSADARITFIQADGVVLGDSDHDPGSMENHLDREEIRQAANEGTGYAVRYSHTLNQNMLYVAVPVVQSGEIVGYERLAMSLADVESSIRRLWTALIIGLAILFFVAGLVSYRVASGLTRPLEEIARVAGRISRSDYASRVQVRRHDEIGQLGEAINTMAANLELQMKRIGDDENRLARLERIRTEFIANVSHELKTPVAAVRGFAETLLAGALEDKETAQSFLQIIYDESDRLNHLVSDILELSRIETKQIPLTFSAIELHSFVDRTLELMRNEAGKKGITLEMDVSEDIFIEADEIRLHQILINLISNAINYTPDGGEISVNAEVVPSSVDSDGDIVCIKVADNGIGIPEHDLPRIFERFYKVDKARSRGMGGTGLGLAIVKHLVELHKGTITVKSQAGSGTTFAIELPMIQH